jgi:nucleoside phosphorylase
MPTKPRFDIGIVVPLAEELDYVLEVAPIIRSVRADGTFFHVLDFGPVTAIAHLVGGMGILAAQHATQKLLDHADVGLLVMLGTAGALDDDLSIGDVAIATEVNEYLANSKAESADGGYELRHSGQHWPLDFGIKQTLANFEFAGRSAYRGWQVEASIRYAGLEIPDKAEVCSPPPALHSGNIASGTVVVASRAFAEQVKRVDRKFIAIDMEAAGFAHAASARVHPVPHLVVRGISDRGDENKKKLDRTSKNGWRRYCVRNATTLLQALLSWDGFLECTGLAASHRNARRDDAVRSLIGALRGSLGGAWVAGVALGIYTHGPLIKPSGNVVPMDVTRLRVTDARFRSLIQLVETELQPGFEIDRVIGAVVTAVGEYRHTMASAAADALMHDFDEVVVQIVLPDSEDPQDSGTSLLGEASRLHEEQGPQAVVDYLKDNVAAGIEVRERYIDALAELEKSSEILAVLQSVPCGDLTRLELEHGLFACGRLGRDAAFREMWSRHAAEFDDAPAKLLRQELSRRFSKSLKIEK